MGRITTLFAFVILITSFISAEIIIIQQPNEIYNIGDTIKIPATVKALNDISGSFEMNLLCNGKDINFYKNGINLAYGEEEKLTPSLVLTRGIIEETIGTCKIKASLIGEDPKITDEFKISNLLNIGVKTDVREFKPGESIVIEGSATKENGKDVNGFLSIIVTSADGDETEYLETISNGFFYANISLEKNAKAGEYGIKLHGYEKDFIGEMTNEGSFEYSVLVIQVPENLEIIFEEERVKPGSSMKVRAILHDQTGENIEGASSMIKITNSKGLLIEQAEKQTNEILEIPILYNEPPGKWNVSVQSGKLTKDAIFEITENKEVKSEVINRTLTVTNVGNIFYNDTIVVKIGNESLDMNISLGVDESKKFILNAPDGEYTIEIFADGKKSVNENVMLTGRAIDVREAKEGVASIIRHPTAWIFMTAILGFVSFIIFKKGYKRSFFGYIYPKRKQEQKEGAPLTKKSLINTSSKAELSLSLKGEKQNISLVCLKIKNLKEIEGKKGSAEESLQNVVSISEEYKSAVYENQDNIFFLLAPVKTRTFKNEKPAVDLAQKIKEILLHNNKLYKQKIEFGISLNYGSIIAKQEGGTLRFMSMGTLITNAKKIAGISNEEILLGENIKEKLISSVKTEKQTKNGVTYYEVKEIKDTEQHKKFISSFLERMEKK